MSRFIKVRTKEGDTLDISVQQYEVGLYVAVSKNGGPTDQFGTDCTEEEFIESIKENEKLEVLQCV